MLPSCPENFEDFLKLISKYLPESTEFYQFLFHDTEGDECEILDQFTFTAFFSEFEKTLILNLVPKLQASVPNSFKPTRQSLKYFRRRTRFCYCYYLDTKETIKTQLDIGISLKEYAAWVDLPSNEVFYCGGGYPVSSPEVFIINPSKGSYRKLPNMLYSRHSHGILYQNGFVYVFGGLENHLEHASVMSKCERFNLADNAWEEINEIEAPRGDVSATVFEDKILVFGKGSKSVTNYFFKSKFLDLDEDSGGCSFVYEGIFYAFHGSCVKVWDLTGMCLREKVVMPGTKSWWSHSPPVWYDGSIYFVWWEEPGWVCRFDTVTKAFSKVKDFC